MTIFQKFSTVTAIALTGCGSSGGSESSTVTGILADGAIGNARYKCGTTAGFTNVKGEFTCPSGSSVDFYYGNIHLGGVSTLPSDKIVLIQDVLDVKRENIENEKVTRMAIFLQSMDNDANHDNGIFLDSKDIESINAKVDFDSFDDAKISALIRKANKTEVLKITAQNNLEETTNNVKNYHNIDGDAKDKPSVSGDKKTPCMTLKGAYYKNSLISASNYIPVGVSSTITFNFSKDLNTSGLNIS